MKTPAEVDVTALQKQVNRLELVLMVSLIALLLFLGVAAFFSTIRIGNFERIFSEMLGDKPLPLVTQWVLSWGRFGMSSLLAVLLPFGSGLFLLLHRNRTIAWWIAITTIPLLFGYLLLINFSLYLPMISIVTEMNHQA